MSNPHETPAHDLAVAAREAAVSQNRQEVNPAILPQHDPIKFYRGEFLVNPATGDQDVHLTHGRGRIPENKNGTTQGQENKADTMVDLGGEVFKQFHDYAVDRVSSLAALADPNRAAPPGSGFNTYLDYILSSTFAARGDAQLIEACCDKVTDQQGRVTQIKVSEDKIKNFLSTAEGYNYLAADMEHTALLTQLGLNMRMVTIPRHEQEKLYKSMKIIFGDIGIGGHIADLYYLVRHKIPSDIWQGFFSTGFKSDQFPAYFHIISHLQNNLAGAQHAVNREYLSALYGINIDALNPQTGDLNQLASDSRTHDPLTYRYNALDQEAALKKAKLALNARRLFLEKLGIDRRKIRFPEDIIFNPTRWNGTPIEAESLPTHYYQELINEYTNRIQGGYLTEYQRATIMDNVRRDIMARTIQTYLQRVEANKNVGRESDARKEKIKDRKEKADNIVAERVKRAKDRATRAAARKTEIGTERTQNLTPLESAESKVRQIENEIQETYHLPSGTNLAQELEHRITTLERTGELSRARARLQRAQNREQRLKYNKDHNINTNVQTFYNNAAAHLPQAQPVPPGLQPPLPYNIADLWNTIYNRVEGTYNTSITDAEKEVANAQQAVTDATAEIQPLRDLLKKYRDALSERTNAADTLSTQFSSVITDCTRSYGLLTAPIPGLRLEQIRDSTVNELLSLAQFPQGRFSDRQRLNIVLQAKAEVARIDYENREYPPTNQQRTALRAIMRNLGLPEQSILTLSDNDLVARLKAAQTPWTPIQITDNILAAKQLVSQRLYARYRGRLAAEEAYQDELIQQGTEAETDARRDIQREITQLELADKILTSSYMDGLYGRAHALTDPGNASQRFNLANWRQIPEGDTAYSQAERNRLRGHVEWIRILFPEYTTNGNRNGEFEALIELLPQDELARIIDSGLGLAVANPSDLTAVLFTLELNNIGGVRVTRDQWHRTYADIVDRIRQRTMVM